MRLSGVIITLHYLVLVSVNGLLDYDMIQSFLQHKSIKYASVIGCFSKKVLEQFELTKKFIKKSMTTSVLRLNIPTIRALESSSHLGVVLDGDCDEAQTFLIASGKRRYFDEKHHWLISVSKKNLTYLFEDVEMYINANIEIIIPEQEENYTIKEVYNPSSKHGGSLKFEKVGFYNTKEGYNVEKTSCKYFARKNMTGVTFKTMVVLPTPVNENFVDYLKRDDNRGTNTLNRYHYNLLGSCKNFYNFTTDLSMSRSWGYKQPDGSVDGLVGALISGLVDYGSSPIYLTTPRIDLLQYGRKTWTLKSAFIFRNPKSLSSVEGFVKPLSASTWILTVISAILLTILLRLSCVYEKKNAHQHSDLSWSNFVVCIVGAMCQQSMAATPNFSSGRIVTLFIFLFAMLIYQFYSASLVSNLLMEPPTRIKSVEDIARSSLKAGCENVTFARQYFQYTTDEYSRKLYADKILGQNNNSNFLSHKTGLELVRKGQFAFHVELAAAYPIIRDTFEERAICELREVQMYSEQSVYANYQKNSPFKKMFDTCYQRLAEVGIMTRDTIFWYPPKPQCLTSSKSGTFNIGLEEFYPALAVLGLGIICSLVVLSFEVYLSHRHLVDNRKGKQILIYPFVK